MTKETSKLVFLSRLQIKKIQLLITTISFLQVMRDNTQALQLAVGS